VAGRLDRSRDPEHRFRPLLSQSKRTGTDARGW